VYKRTLPIRKDWIEKQNRYKARNENRGEQSAPEARERTPVIHVISGGLASGGDTHRERRKYLDRQEGLQVMSVEGSVGEKRPREEPICFSSSDREGITGPHDDAIVLSLKINVHRVERILIDTGSSADILYMPVFLAMGYEPEDLQPIRTPLVGFTGDTLQSEGRIKMRVDFGNPPQKVSTMVDFLVVDSPSAYNVILGRNTLNAIGAVISPSCLKIKFHTDNGIGEEKGHQRMARECYKVSLKGRGTQALEAAKLGK
jgi:hypothetical protein